MLGTLFRKVYHRSRTCFCKGHVWRTAVNTKSKSNQFDATLVAFGIPIHVDIVSPTHHTTETEPYKQNTMLGPSCLKHCVVRNSETSNVQQIISVSKKHYYPFLPVWVLEIVNTWILKLVTQTEEPVRTESALAKTRQNKRSGRLRNRWLPPETYKQNSFMVLYELVCR